MLDKIIETLDTYSPLVAYISLLISLCNIGYEFFKDRRSKFKIKVVIEDPFLFSPIDTSTGNRHSLTFLCRIINQSNAPVNISDIQVVHKNGISSSCTKKAIKRSVYRPTPDGAKLIDFETDMIKLPGYLNGYEELSGRVLIAKAGGNYIRGMNKVRVRIVTSRRDIYEEINIYQSHDDMIWLR